MVYSALATADNPQDIEVVVYDDSDTNEYNQIPFPDSVKIYRTSERQTVSKYWDMACQKARGPIYMMANDDLVFRTDGWDTEVYTAFNKYPDRIVLVYGNDGDPREKEFAPHPFVHQEWVDAVGRYVPPYFSGDFPDTWLNELADGVDRKHKIEILIEHIHPAFNKRLRDDTDKERWKKHFEDNMPKLYEDTLPERKAEIAKLKAALDG